jgi:ligand-binding SRPBCC domain-containing protein
MRLSLKSAVNQPMRTVFDRFDQELFEYLLPDFPKMTLIQFDGSKENDLVHIRIEVFQGIDWISEITEESIEENVCYFVDEGQTLPWPLKKWRHQHVVRALDHRGAVIEDQIEFSSGYAILDLILFPILYLAFYPRRKAYKEYFGKYEK